MAVKVTLFQIQMKRNTTLFIPFDERRRSCTFHISNVSAGTADNYAIFMDGNEEYKIRNINIDNFHIKEAQYPYYLMNTECINFTQSSVNGKNIPESPKESPQKISLDVY